jgi:hypothetical protein
VTLTCLNSTMRVGKLVRALISRTFSSHYCRINFSREIILDLRPPLDIIGLFILSFNYERSALRRAKYAKRVISLFKHFKTMIVGNEKGLLSLWPVFTRKCPWKRGNSKQNPYMDWILSCDVVEVVCVVVVGVIPRQTGLRSQFISVGFFS